MILLKLHQTWRQRCMEWMLSAGLTGWGGILLLPDAEFAHNTYYQPLANIASENVWGLAALVIGAGRLTLLYINGSWRKSPGWRQVGSIFGLTVWSGLLFGSIVQPKATPISAISVMILLMEYFSLTFAMDDARTQKKEDANGG